MTDYIGVCFIIVQLFIMKFNSSLHDGGTRWSSEKHFAFESSSSILLIETSRIEFKVQHLCILSYKNDQHFWLQRSFMQLNSGFGFTWVCSTMHCVSVNVQFLRTIWCLKLKWQNKLVVCWTSLLEIFKKHLPYS